MANVHEARKDLQTRTPALMVLKTFDVLALQHGYGIARRIEQISGDTLFVNQGTHYPVRLRLEQEGAVASDWGPSENKQTAATSARFFEVKAEDFA